MISVASAERRRGERDPLAVGPVLGAGRAVRRGDTKFVFARPQITLGPAGAGQRPFSFRPGNETVEGTDLQLDRGLVAPGALVVLQEPGEEAFLQVHAVVGVEVGPVFQAVHLEPLVRGGGAGEPLEVAPGVQALPAPVGGGQYRHGDVLPARRPVAVEVAVERAGGDLPAEVHPVRGEFRLGEGLRACHGLAGHRAARAVVTDPVLDDDDLLVVPVPHEGGQDAAMVGAVPVEVGRALPDADRGQVGRLEARDVPGVHRVVGDAVDARPCRCSRAACRPTRCTRRSPGSPGGERVEQTGRAARAARVHPDARVAVGDPLLRVHGFPVLEPVAGVLGHVGVCGDHHPPLVRVAVLKCQALGVRAVGDDHRVRVRSGRAEHIGAEHHAVVHGNRYIPVDHHGRDDTAPCGASL